MHHSAITLNAVRIIISGFLCVSLWSCAGTVTKKILSNATDVPDSICIKTGFTNAFLIPGTGGYLLIDTGYADDYDEFLSALAENSIDVKQITHIFLTHHHDDHAGFAARLVKESNARLIVHKAGVSALNRGRNDPSLDTLNTCVTALAGAFLFFHDDEYPPVELTSRDSVINGDDFSTLENLGIPGKIITTPGHTRDSVTIVLNSGYAFVGDAAMDLLSICMCDHQPIFVENRSKVFSSLKKLKSSGATRIFPAHGDSFDIEELSNLF